MGNVSVDQECCSPTNDGGGDPLRSAGLYLLSWTSEQKPTMRFMSVEHPEDPKASTQDYTQTLYILTCFIFIIYFVVFVFFCVI